MMIEQHTNQAADMDKDIGGEMSVWKLWETAPRDGKQILICFPFQPNTYGLAHYNTIHHYWIVNGASHLGLDGQGCLWMALPAESLSNADQCEREKIALKVLCRLNHYTLGRDYSDHIDDINTLVKVMR